MDERPSPNGGNGRDALGRFAKGNPGGPGKPYARRVAELRLLIREAVTEDDLRAIVSALVERAKAGDVVAAREVFNRLVGRPASFVEADLDQEDGDIGVDTVSLIRQYHLDKVAREEAERGADGCGERVVQASAEQAE